MALKITLVAATGMLVLEKDSNAAIRRPSQNLFYDLQNSTLVIYEKNGNLNQVLASEANTAIQNSSAVTLLTDTDIRVYLDSILGIQEAAAATSIKNDIATVKADIALMKADTATIKADIATVKADIALVKADMRKQVWTTIAGNSIVKTYFTGVAEGNVSGAANLQKEDYKISGTTSFTITYAYNVVNAITSIITS